MPLTEIHYDNTYTLTSQNILNARIYQHIELSSVFLFEQVSSDSKFMILCFMNENCNDSCSS